MKKLLILSCLSLCLLLAPLSQALAAEIVLQLPKQTDYSRQDFGTGTYPAYTMVWAGDVNYLGNKIGDFTAILTKTTYTGTAGYAINYDLIIPGGGSIGEFVSVRTAHITTGSGSDHGTIYAASPAFKGFIGSTVEMTGDTMRILY